MGNTLYTQADVVEYLRKVIDEKCGGSQKEFAERSGISAQYINDVLLGRKEPGKKILNVLQYERVTLYRDKRLIG